MFSRSIGNQSLPCQDELHLQANTVIRVDSRSRQQETERRVLVMTAVSAERDAVLRGMGCDSRFDVLVAGVGPVAAAVSTATALATAKYDLIVSAGLGGGFADRAEVGSLVVADEIVAADLGAQTSEGFRSLDELGLGSTRVRVDLERVNQVAMALHAAGLAVITGPVLTLSTVTGTATAATELMVRVPRAVAEAMEGFGVAAAAHQHGLPILEIRAISNTVGPRNRAAWRIDDGLGLLATASFVLREVLI
jgi:futalosine hydrolase